MNFYQEDDYSVETIDFENNYGNSDTLGEFSGVFNGAETSHNSVLDVSDTTRPTQYPASNALKKSTTICLSSLPESIRKTAMSLDRNQDGDLSVEEIAFALRELEKKRQSNKHLKKTVLGFVALLVAMVVCIFAASLTAARLSKDFDVSPTTGLVLAKGASAPTVLKTHTALFSSKNVSVGGLSNRDLGNLRVLALEAGDLRLVVKGYSRDPFDLEKKVVILIEGGTITYDAHGIVAATGNARLALEAIYGLDIFDEDGRRLTGEDTLSWNAGFAGPQISGKDLSL